MCPSQEECRIDMQWLQGNVYKLFFFPPKYSTNDKFLYLVYFTYA